MSFSPAEGANSAPPNALAGFEGPLSGQGKERGKGWKGEERKARKGRGENTPS